jgi:hypothetical protein
MIKAYIFLEFQIKLLILYLVVIGSVSGTFVQRQTNEAPKYQTISGNFNNGIDSLVNASMADSTWKTYKTAVESFQSFRKLYNLQDTWPAPPH